MGRGILAGIGLGALVSIGLAVLVSFLVPMHRPTPNRTVAQDDAGVPAQTQPVQQPDTTELAKGPSTDADSDAGVQNSVADETTGATADASEPVEEEGVKDDDQAQVQMGQSDLAAKDTEASQDTAAAEVTQPVVGTDADITTVRPEVGEAATMAELPAQVVQADATTPAQEAPVTTTTPTGIAQPSDGNTGNDAVELLLPTPDVGTASTLADPQGSTTGGDVVVAAMDSSPAVQSVQKPQQPADRTSDTGDLDSAIEMPRPKVGAVAGLDAVSDPDVAAVPSVAATEPVLPNPQALAPMEPEDETDVVIDTVTAKPPVQQAETPAQSQTAPDTGAGLTTRRAGSIVDREGRSTSVRVNRLGSDTEATATPVDPAIDAPETVPEVDADTPPIERFAQPFDDPEGRPLMSIVLMDTGVDLSADEIGVPALKSFPYPITFAVDSSLPDATERMQRYRDEGFEVLAMIDLPEGAQPADVEVTLSVALDRMDAVVGILGGTGTGLQESREASDQVTAILAATGHGLVTQPQGLNTMPKLARKAGVPAMPVFRDFDGKGQEARVIRRFLDQAAFKARQEGGVIMLGRLRPETIKALLVWGLAERANQVALVPVSALLRLAQ